MKSNDEAVVSSVLIPSTSNKLLEKMPNLCSSERYQVLVLVLLISRVLYLSSVQLCTVVKGASTSLHGIFFSLEQATERDSESTLD